MVIATIIESEGLVNETYKLSALLNENNEYTTPYLEFPEDIKEAWDNDKFLYYHVFRVLKGKKPKVSKELNINEIPLEHRPELLEMFKKAKQLGFFNKQYNNGKQTNK